MYAQSFVYIRYILGPIKNFVKFVSECYLLVYTQSHMFCYIILLLNCRNKPEWNGISSKGNDENLDLEF